MVVVDGCSVDVEDEEVDELDDDVDFDDDVELVDVDDVKLDCAWESASALMYTI